MPKRLLHDRPPPLPFGADVSAGFDRFAGEESSASGIARCMGGDGIRGVRGGGWRRDKSVV